MCNRDSIYDFTTRQYAELLALAKAQYRFVSYSERLEAARFVLWRHDCDFSMNRALCLAKIEHQQAVKATYFLRPHGEGYSLLEKSQAKIAEKILGLGHDIGLHFDVDFYDVQSEEELDALIRREAGWLRDWFGAQPAAVSFHTPTRFELSCERDTYGGLLNCYSRTFRDKVPYCSDSNGYWRFRRLRDVLARAEEAGLQVLTHPELWQEQPLHPRERIFRTIYGRAEATMRLYDGILQACGRDNRAGPAAELRFLKDLDAELFQFCDYLWNGHHFQSLFLELWRLHERQISQLCKILFCRGWKVPAAVVEVFFDDPSSALEGRSLFEAVFQEPWANAGSSSKDVHEGWATVRQQLIHGRDHVASGQLEDGCVHLCKVLEATAKWGMAQHAIGHDGITPLDKVRLGTRRMADGESAEQPEEATDRGEGYADKRWIAFLNRLAQREVATRGEILR
jgi:hypothetical protein